MTACSDLRWGQPRDLPKRKRVGTGDAPLLGDEPSEVEDDREDDDIDIDDYYVNEYDSRPQHF